MGFAANNDNRAEDMTVRALEPEQHAAGTALYADPASRRARLDAIKDMCERAIVELDRALGRQLDEILHHPRFQQLEASWRGLHHLVETEADYDDELKVKIKVLNVSWKELAKDVSKALEFDQSQIFHRIYSDEFDTPGGEPFGILLGDYEVSHRGQPDTPTHDVVVLTEMAQIAMAALCPFITNASSALFGLNSFRELTQPASLDSLFQQREYAKWRSLRRNEHTRFVGLTLPRVLMREPYRADGTRREPFTYREGIHADPENYLWGRACYAFGGVVIRAFANTGWFADIRGGTHEFGEGGVVRDMVYDRYDMDPKGIAARPTTEVQVNDFGERELSEFGFIPLCSYHSVEHSAFYSNSSLHQPEPLGSEIADLNAKLSSMIQYMLCVSRFGHYIKVMGRDKVGSFTSAEECQRMFHDWLQKYTTSAQGESAELKARYPLADSRVEVTERPGLPGHLNCVIHLQPHFQLDQLVSAIRLVTELAVGPTGQNA